MSAPVPRHFLALHSLAVAVCSKLLTEVAGLRCQKRKAPAGGWGARGARGAGAFDLRDKNSSRDRRYNVRPANWFPTMRIELDRLHPFAFAALRQAA